MTISPWLPAITILAVALHRFLDPAVAPAWFTIPQPWRALVVAVVGAGAAALAAKADGNDWPVAIAHGLATIAAAGGLNHGLPASQGTPPNPGKPESARKA